MDRYAACHAIILLCLKIWKDSTYIICLVDLLNSGMILKLIDVCRFVVYNYSTVRTVIRIFREKHNF